MSALTQLKVNVTQTNFDNILEINQSEFIRNNLECKQYSSRWNTDLKYSLHQASPKYFYSRAP